VTSRVHDTALFRGVQPFERHDNDGDNSRNVCLLTVQQTDMTASLLKSCCIQLTRKLYISFQTVVGLPMAAREQSYGGTRRILGIILSHN